MSKKTISSIPTGGTPPFYIVYEGPKIEAPNKNKGKGNKIKQEYGDSLQGIIKMKDIIEERKKTNIFADIE